ncbi:50S ribosomal protein L25/general stress protein Ctc [Cellulomonas sp. 179-A 9B4 NHS]|uniref:50S ribosomal protein L25/general stress protein Ctc n=1 Tax=Cellulomonas sp. 179-A 9B4 NHS TaxID=3142379 RepID=UPI0039A2FA93
MSDVKLAATTRTEFGKGAARRLRRAHQVPAVLYGHGTQPQHVALPGHETMLALKHTNALFEIELEGETVLTIVKDVQRDVVRQVIEHVDLLIVRRGEMVSVDVPVVVTGESAPGTIHVVETQTLSLEADATKLPSSVDVSIEGLAAGTSVTAGDVVLPDGSTLMSDADQVVVVISEPQASAADVADEQAVADLAAQQSAASGADA